LGINLFKQGKEHPLFLYMEFFELYLFLGYQNPFGGFMELQGSAEIGMSKAKAFEILKDPEKIAKLIPGIQSFEREGDGVKMSVMVGYSFIKGRFNIKLAKTREENGSHVELKGNGSGAGTSIDFLSKFDIVAKDEDLLSCRGMRMSPLGA
jgi:Uncharacterized conserved protein, COG3427